MPFHSKNTLEHWVAEFIAARGAGEDVHVAIQEGHGGQDTGLVVMPLENAPNTVWIEPRERLLLQERAQLGRNLKLGPLRARHGAEGRTGDGGSGSDQLRTQRPHSRGCHRVGAHSRTTLWMQPANSMRLICASAEPQHLSGYLR